MAALTFKVSGDTSALNQSITKSKGMLGGLASAGGKIGLGLAAGLAAGGAALGVLGAKMISVGEAAGTANARITSVATSMGLFGDEAGSVSQRLQKLAAATELATGVDRNQIKLTQAKLLTFKELGKTADEVGGNFDRATAAAVDMAAAGFGTAETNAVQLGKALNDPIKGITALGRSGVTFTDAEKDKIRTLVESNKMLEAQGVVLEALEAQVGGAAKATANSSERIKAAFSQAFEKVSLPFSEMLDRALPSILGFFEEMQPKLEGLVAQGVRFGKVLIAAFSSGELPTLLGAGLMLAGKNLVNFMVGHVRGLLAGIWAWVKNIPELVIGGFRALTSPDFWKGMVDTLVGAARLMGVALLNMLPKQLMDVMGVDQASLNAVGAGARDQMGAGLSRAGGALEGLTSAIVDGGKGFAKAYLAEVRGADVLDTSGERERIRGSVEKIVTAAGLMRAEAAAAAGTGLTGPKDGGEQEERAGGILSAGLKPIISSLAASGGAAGLLGIGKNMDAERNSLLKSIERNTRERRGGSNVAVYA